MFFEETSKINRNRLDNQELESLLGESSLFPSQGEPINAKQLEAEDVLKNASLYSMTQAQGEWKNKIPPLTVSKRKIIQENKRKKDQTAGPEWFNMKAMELTPELKNDLDAIRLRSHLDPKKFYRRTDMKDYPKFFSIGTIVNAPSEPLTDNLARSSRNKTLAEQLLEEDEEKNFTKRKWTLLMKSKTKKKHNRTKGTYKRNRNK